MHSHEWQYHYVLSTMLEKNNTSGKLNKCGIHMNHAYAVLDVIPLWNQNRTEVENGLLMIRDPFGQTAITSPHTRWNVHDTIHWTEDYKK